MKIKAAVLTVSDSVAKGTRIDESGPAVQAHLESLGWEVWEVRHVPDEEDAIANALRNWAEAGVALLVTTGGTGVSARDVTPEATRRVIEREIPGVAELMRARGLEKTSFSVLSRGIAGTRGRSFIVNLPGNPAGAVDSFRVMQHLVPHVVDLLAGRTEHH